MGSSFECPACATPSLGITRRIELLPGPDEDELCLQTTECENCRFCGVAIYTESRRGASESWHHDGYRMSTEDFQLLATLIDQCPALSDKHCPCPTHAALNRSDASVMRKIFRLGDGFWMKFR